MNIDKQKEGTQYSRACFNEQTRWLLYIPMKAQALKMTPTQLSYFLLILISVNN